MEGGLRRGPGQAICYVMSRHTDDHSPLTAQRGSAEPSVAWTWSAAMLGVAYSVPAVVVMPFDVLNGLALAFGVLPAAVVGLAPSRRQRAHVVLLGACMGIPIWFGSLLSG